MRRSRVRWLTLCWLLLATGPASAVETPLAESIAQTIAEARGLGLDGHNLDAFYRPRDHEPIWVGPRGPNERAFTWTRVLMAAEDDGLSPQDYHLPAIRERWLARDSRGLAQLELLLSDAFFRYSVEVRVGYPAPRAVDQDWHLPPPPQPDPVNLLYQALAGDGLQDFLATLPPPHPQYRKLKAALSRYRQMALAGEWPTLPDGPSLKLGVRHIQVALLRERLAREGLLKAKATTDAYLYDREVEEAVRRFQLNYGRKVDGIVGRYTRRTLNVPLKVRIGQLERNMERWRWLPRNLGERYIMVNMAGYTLKLVEKDQTSLHMRVVIGKPFRSTPAFRDEMTYLEINPTWKVPPRIAREEMLPKLREDASYLVQRNIRVYSSWYDDAVELQPEAIDWGEVDDKRFPYKLEQDPGANNSMGRIKFMFPNPFRIYLHDTPARYLFNRRKRTFSSGCIRVERPVTLAAKLLGEDRGWSTGDVREAIRTAETRRVDLPVPVPVFLLYWTVWVEDNGDVHFRDDVYQRNVHIATTYGGEHVPTPAALANVYY